MDPTIVTENWWQWLAGIGITFLAFLVGIARHMFGKIDEAREAAEKADTHIWTALQKDRDDNARRWDENARFREINAAQMAALPTRAELDATADRIIEELRGRR